MNLTENIQLFLCARDVRVRELKHLRHARATRTRAILARTRNIFLALRARNARARDRPSEIM